MQKIIQFFKQPILIKIILFVSIILLLFHVINLNQYISTFTTISEEMSGSFLKGDYWLNGWNISCNGTKIIDFIYYLIPVKILGLGSKAVMYALFLVILLSVFLGYLLVTSNRKEAHINDILFYVCLLGISPTILVVIGEYGTYIPLLFLCLFLFNKYIKTEKIQYLIIATVASALWVFSDMFAILFLIIPLLLYASIKLFFTEQMKKNFRILLAVLFAVSSGLFLFTIYTKLHNQTTFLTDVVYFSFYDKPKYHILYRFYEIINEILKIQNANFISSEFFSLQVPVFMSRLLITIIGIILSLKVFFNTLFVPKYKTDFISFVLAAGILLIFLFAFYIETGVNEHVQPLWSFIPFAIAIIIMRYKRWLNKINPFSYNILLIILCCLTLLSCFPN